MRLPVLLLLTSIAPLLAKAETPSLIMREYRVSPGFVEWFEGGKRDPEKQEFASASGVAYPPGSTGMIYLPSSNTLAVNDSKEYHRLVRQLIAQWEKARITGAKPDPAILNALKAAHIDPNSR